MHDNKSRTYTQKTKINKKAASHRHYEFIRASILQTSLTNNNDECTIEGTE